jgi:hypothetical protein
MHKRDFSSVTVIDRVHVTRYWCLSYGLTFADRIKKIRTSHHDLATDWGLTQVYYARVVNLRAHPHVHINSLPRIKPRPLPLHSSRAFQKSRASTSRHVWDLWVNRNILFLVFGFAFI